MNKKGLLYILVIVLTYSAISVAWSARDIQAYRIEKGVGFDLYQPRLGKDLGLHAAVFIISLGVGVWIFRADALLACLYAVSTAYLFYFTHRDPFYKDWLEDCSFAMLGYILAGILCFAIKDVISKVVARLKR